MESAPVAENTLPPSVLPMLGSSPNQSADSQSSDAVFGRGAGVWVAEALKPLSTTLPPLPTLLTVFLLPPSILPQAALEEIHRFSGTYTCMNTFKGRT